MSYYPRPPYGGQPYGQPYTQPYGQQPYGQQPYGFQPFFRPPVPEQEAERRLLRKRALFAGTALLAMIAAQFAVVLPLSDLINRTDAHKQDSLQGLLLYTLVQAALTLGIIIIPTLVVAMAFRQRPRPLTARRRVGAGTVAMMLLAGLGICFFANMIANMVQQICAGSGIPTGYTDQVEENLTTSVWSLLSSLFLTAVLPALFEELAFRGFILESLRPFGDGKAVLMSALLFGMLHLNLVQIPFAFMLGLVFGYFYVKTNNLLLVILLHFLNNGVLAVGTGYVSRFLSKADGELFSGLFMCTLAALGGVALLLLLRKRHPAVTAAHAPDSTLPSRERTRLLWCSPTVIIALVALVLLTLMVMAASAVG